MTQREFFNAVITANVSAEITAFAKERIAHLDTVNDNRKSKGTVTQRENAVLRADILAKVDKGVTYTANEIATLMGITTAKASAMCKQIAENGNATVTDVKIKGKGKVKGYTFTDKTPAVEADPIDKVYTLSAEPTVEG